MERRYVTHFSTSDSKLQALAKPSASQNIIKMRLWNSSSEWAPARSQVRKISLECLKTYTVEVEPNDAEPSPSFEVLRVGGLPVTVVQVTHIAKGAVWIIGFSRAKDASEMGGIGV